MRVTCENCERSFNPENEKEPAIKIAGLWFCANCNDKETLDGHIEQSEFQK